MSTDTLLKLENAKRAIRLARASLDYKTAPKFNKDEIEAERIKAEQGLSDALELLKMVQEYLLKGAK
jgi:hypothetical protein